MPINSFNSTYLVSRRKNFVYKCSCVENCQQRKKILCKIDSTTRSYCKFCKYSKCVAAGMMKTQVKNGFSEYRMKDKTNLGNSKPKKIKCSPKEDKNSENDKATPSSCSMDSSTPTKIIDIAQTYSRKSLFISDDVSFILVMELYGHQSIYIFPVMYYNASLFYRS